MNLAKKIVDEIQPPPLLEWRISIRSLWLFGFNLNAPFQSSLRSDGNHQYLQFMKFKLQEPLYISLLKNNMWINHGFPWITRSHNEAVGWEGCSQARRLGRRGADELDLLGLWGWGKITWWMNGWFLMHFRDMVFPKSRGTPRWLVYQCLSWKIRNMDDLGVPP